MLIEEAMWFGERMGAIEAGSLSPLLNLGSSTEVFRKKFQPWLDEYVLDPLQARGVLVRNQDLKPLPGVEIVGDLSDERFLRELSNNSFQAILCANLLEHLENRERLARAMLDMLPAGGFLFVSCPRRFPFHPDPIDTAFRPDVEELAALFPSCRRVAGEIVTCSTYADHLRPHKRRGLLKMALRLGVPFYRPGTWLVLARHVPWLSRRLEATCLVLQKA